VVKLLLLLACLVVPVVWGLIVGRFFVRHVPARWRREPEFDAGKYHTNGPSAYTWFYEI